MIKLKKILTPKECVEGELFRRLLIYAVKTRFSTKEREVHMIGAVVTAKDGKESLSIEAYNMDGMYYHIDGTTRNRAKRMRKSIIHKIGYDTTLQIALIYMKEYEKGHENLNIEHLKKFIKF